jgi:hypothetical protein
VRERWAAVVGERAEHWIGARQVGGSEGTSRRGLHEISSARDDQSEAHHRAAAVRPDRLLQPDRAVGPSVERPGARPAADDRTSLDVHETRVHPYGAVDAAAPNETISRSTKFQTFWPIDGALQRARISPAGHDRGGYWRTGSAD